MKPLPGLAFALLAPAAWAQVPWLEAEMPRAFGYQVGDLVRGLVVVHAPDGWTFDSSSLPAADVHGGALELRRITTRDAAEGGGRRHEISLEYQVFAAPSAVHTYEVPPWRLRVKGPERVEELRVDAWPVTVAPLMPVEVSPRRGLGELQPDREPPRIETRGFAQQLLACAAVALTLLAWLGWPRLRARWSQDRPFEQAWQALRRLPPQPGDEAWRAACLSLHGALNRSAGEAVFTAGVERLVARRPGLAALRPDIQRFLALSQREFFGGAARDAGDAVWLVALARRLRDAERGGA